MNKYTLVAYFVYSIQSTLIKKKKPKYATFDVTINASDSRDDF